MCIFNRGSNIESGNVGRYPGKSIIALSEKLELKIEIIDYFHTESTLKYFKYHIQSRTINFYGPCKVIHDTDSMFPTLVKVD